MDYDAEFTRMRRRLDALEGNPVSVPEGDVEPAPRSSVEVELKLDPELKAELDNFAKHVKGMVDAVQEDFHSFTADVEKRLDAIEKWSELLMADLTAKNQPSEEPPPQPAHDATDDAADDESKQEPHRGKSKK